VAASLLEATEGGPAGQRVDLRAGSYGWPGAGAGLHHSPSVLKAFLGAVGGFTTARAANHPASARHRGVMPQHPRPRRHHPDGRGAVARDGRGTPGCWVMFGGATDQRNTRLDRNPGWGAAVQTTTTRNELRTAGGPAARWSAISPYRQREVNGGGGGDGPAPEWGCRSGPNTDVGADGCWAGSNNAGGSTACVDPGVHRNPLQRYDEYERYLTGGETAW